MPLSVTMHQWVEAVLNGSIVREVFTHEHLSAVAGLELADGRMAVVKARPDAVRARCCVDVQRALAADGYPCPMPLTAVHEVDGLAVHLEAFVVAERDPPEITSDTRRELAALLADLVARCRRLALCRPRPLPMWLAWDHRHPGVWPDEPVERPPTWLTGLAERCRARVRAVRLDDVVAHGDWEVQNMGWRGGRVAVVHDWDSLVTAPEAAIAGAAAATFQSGHDQPILSDLSSTERFLDDYQAAAGRTFERSELEVAWAAGAWLAAHNARMELRYRTPPLVLEQLRHDGADRLRHACA